MSGRNPCLKCGACCAFFRVTMRWTESELGRGEEGIPLSMTEDVDAFYLAMTGTTGDDPRCIALEGVIGREVRCTIYERRHEIGIMKALGARPRTVLTLFSMEALAVGVLGGVLGFAASYLLSMGADMLLNLSLIHI